MPRKDRHLQLQKCTSMDPLESPRYVIICKEKDMPLASAITQTRTFLFFFLLVEVWITTTEQINKMVKQHCSDLLERG